MPNVNNRFEILGVHHLCQSLLNIDLCGGPPGPGPVCVAGHFALTEPSECGLGLFLANDGVCARGLVRFVGGQGRCISPLFFYYLFRTSIPATDVRTVWPGRF